MAMDNLYPLSLANSTREQYSDDSKRRKSSKSRNHEENFRKLLGVTRIQESFSEIEDEK